MSVLQACELLTQIIVDLRLKSTRFDLTIESNLSDDLLIAIVKLHRLYHIHIDVNLYNKLGSNIEEIYNNTSQFIAHCYENLIVFNRDPIINKIEHKRKYYSSTNLQCNCLEYFDLSISNNELCESCKLVKKNTTVMTDAIKVANIYINKIEYRYCKTCKTWKVLNDFSVKKKTSRKSMCKECDKIRGAKYRFDNLEKEQLRHQIYDNSEHGKAVHSNYYYDNHERLRMDQAAYNEEHKDEIKAQQREAYAEDPEKFKERQRIHRADPINRGLIRMTKTIHMRKKRQNDPEFKLMDGLRNHFYQMIKGNIKSDSVIKLIGCTIEELFDKLEEKFQPGMTRNNRGNNGWHVDHIIPCALYDFSSEEEQRCCYHYSNLQPLWARDNMSKGKKLSRETYLEHRARLCASIVVRLDEMFGYNDDVELFDEDEDI